MAALLQSFAPSPFANAMIGESNGTSTAGSGEGVETASGNSAQAALQALFESFSNASQTTSSTSSGTTAQDALQALLESYSGSSQAASTSSNGNSAQDALYDLLQADTNTNGTASSPSSDTASTTTNSTAASLFNKISQTILAQLLQFQSQGTSA
jgi:hypothetical protein